MKLQLFHQLKLRHRITDAALPIVTTSLMLLVLGLAAIWLKRPSSSTPLQEQGLTRRVALDHIATIEHGHSNIKDDMTSVEVEIGRLDRSLRDLMGRIKSGRSELNWYLQQGRTEIAAMQLELSGINKELRLVTDLISTSLRELSDAADKYFSLDHDDKMLRREFGQLATENKQFVDWHKELLSQRDDLAERLVTIQSLVEEIEEHLRRGDEIERKIEEERLRLRRQGRGFRVTNNEVLRELELCRQAVQDDVEHVLARL